MIKAKPKCVDCGAQSGTEIEQHTGRPRKMHQVFGRNICGTCYRCRLVEKMGTSKAAREGIEAIVFSGWKKRLEGRQQKSET